MRSATLGRPVEVLLLEDSPGEIRVAHAILKDVDADIWVRVNVVTNREQATAFLNREAPFTDAPRPDLVLLDLKQPETDAPDVPRDIPTTLLKGACRHLDCRLPEALCRRCHMTESPESDDYEQVVRAVKDVWQGLQSMAAD